MVKSFPNGFTSKVDLMKYTIVSREGDIIPVSKPAFYSLMVIKKSFVKSGRTLYI